MAEPASDEEFAKFARQSLMATAEQVESARKMQAVSQELGTPLSLSAALVQQGVITPAQRDSVQQKLDKERESAGKLGPYKLLRKIGEGGMGAVYLAENPAEAGRRVALKVLPRKHLKDVDFLNRFRREAEAAIQLNHVNIARAFSVAEDRGLPYYVMEYCEGETLKEMLKREKSLPHVKATEIVLQIARGLKYAHELGFIHRDIKPDNVMVSGQGVAKVLDLGLTKNIEDAEQSYRTVSGIAIGTPHYIAPEQARGERDLDGRADIYSLGATYYHLVTGDTPFHGSSSYEIITKHLTEQLPDPRDLREDIPVGVVEVIRKMMAKKPAHRYPDCGALLADLELLVDGKAPTTQALDATLSSIALPKARRPMAARKSTVRRDGSAAPKASRKQLAVIGGLSSGILVVILVIVIKLSGDKPARHEPTPEPPPVAVTPVPLPPKPPPLKPPSVPAPPPPSAEDLREGRAKQRFSELQELEKTGKKSAAEMRPLYESFIQEFEGTATASSASDWLKVTTPLPEKTPPPSAGPTASSFLPVPDFSDAGWTKALPLLHRIDPARDGVAGAFRDGRLGSTGNIPARVQIPYQPPEEYDLRVVFARVTGNEVAVMLPHAGRSFQWTMGSWSNTAQGFELVRGEGSGGNPTTVKEDRTLENGRRTVLMLQVRQAGVAAYLDGRFITEWKTDYKDLSMPAGWKLRDASVLGLGTLGITIFLKIDILEITGTGKPKASEPPPAAPVVKAPEVKAPEVKAPEPAKSAQDFPALSAQALKTVWTALMDKKGALQKQTLTLKKPGFPDAQYTIKDLTAKALQLEMQFGGGTMEATEKPETLAPDTMSFLVQKASLLPSGEIRKSMGVLWAAGGNFDLAYRELGKAKTEGADAGDLFIAVAKEELARAGGKKTPQERLAQLKSFASTRTNLWPEEVRKQLAAEISALEREVQAAEGILGLRLGDHMASVTRGGGSRETEAAVLAALKWLAHHQSPNGSWGTETYSQQCTSLPRCSGIGWDGFGPGVTSLAVLAFLGAGYTPSSKDEFADPINPAQTLRFGEVVRKGLLHLLALQGPDGCIGEHGQKYMYNHVVGAVALAEAYAMTSSASLRMPTQKAIDFLIAAQNPGKAWRYSSQCLDNDTSVMGWAVSALKSAELSDLVFPRSAYDGALNWLSEATEPKGYYQTGYNARGTGKVFVPGKNEAFDHHAAMSAVAIVSRIFITKRKTDPSLTAVNLLVSDLPEWKTNKTDLYYWYYGSIALFQYDGPDGPMWKRWNPAMKSALLTYQATAKEGCLAGSWSPDTERWGFEGGRVYMAAMGALTLETYYRYAPLTVKSR